MDPAQLDLHSFPDREALNLELAFRIATLLQEGIQSHGQASLAVSGGSTPVPLFKRLALQDIPWQKVHISLVDERWVAPDAPDSNEHLVRGHLLKDRAAAATFSGLKNDAPTALDGEVECTKICHDIPRPYDVLLLGMGLDGHTASLFPKAQGLTQATALDCGRLCMAMTSKTAPHERMTLTLPAILDSRNILLLINGDDKKGVLDQAMQEGPASAMPIRFLLNQTPLHHKKIFSVYWAH